MLTLNKCHLPTKFVCVQAVNNKWSDLRKWATKNVTLSLGKIIRTTVQSKFWRTPPLFVPEATLHRDSPLPWTLPLLWYLRLWTCNLNAAKRGRLQFYGRRPGIQQGVFNEHKVYKTEGEISWIEHCQLSLVTSFRARMCAAATGATSLSCHPCRAQLSIMRFTLFLWNQLTN